MNKNIDNYFDKIVRFITSMFILFFSHYRLNFIIEDIKYNYSVINSPFIFNKYHKYNLVISLYYNLSFY